MNSLSVGVPEILIVVVLALLAYGAYRTDESFNPVGAAWTPVQQ